MKNLNKTYTPIALFCYNRLRNTKEVIEALQKNTIAKETELYIFSDGPKNERGRPLVNKLRAYLHTISGFKQVQIIERKTNYYIEQNIVEGINEVLSKHNRVIVFEDDGVANPHCLEFLNNTLDFYEKYPQIMMVCAANYATQFPTDFRHTIIWRYPENSGGGWATWKNRWEKFQWLTDNRQQSLTSAEKKYLELDGIFPCLSGPKLDVISWDISWYTSMVKNKGLVVSTPHSLLTNNGFYNGVHTFLPRWLAGKNSFEISSTDARNDYIFEDNIKENTLAIAYLKDFWKNKKKTTIRNKVFSTVIYILAKSPLAKPLKWLLRR